MSYASKLMTSANKNSMQSKAEVQPEKTEEVAAATTNEPSVEESPAPEAEIQAETVEDLEALKKRTAESLEDEVKELRRKEAEKRVKLKKQQEIFDQERQQYEAQMAEMKAQLEELSKLKKAKVEDEVEKSAEVKARESEIAKMAADNAELKKQLDVIAKAQRDREEREKEEKELREKVVKSRFDEELKSIPEDKQKFARSIYAGAEGDAQEKLFAFLEAKREGLFGKKQVQVMHKPATTQTTNTENKPEKLSSKLKIKRGLAEKLKGGLKPGHL